MSVGGWTWHVPTAVVAGDGALDGLGDAVRSRWPRARTALVVADAGVATATPLVGRCRAALDGVGMSTEVVEHRGVPTLEQARGLLARAREAAPDLVVAVGGGSVLDLAKVAVAAWGDPAVVTSAGRPRGGLVTPTTGADRGVAADPTPPLVAVPTTVGTGSEVSTVACLLAGERKKLWVHPSLRPAVAVVDPEATRHTPRPVVVEGALEVLLRLVGPLVGEAAARPVQDALALAVAREVVRDGDLVARSSSEGTRRPDDEEVAARHRLALASVSTHATFSSAGRDPFAHRLWYLANEASTLLTTTKMAVTSALLVPYVQAVEHGRLPGVGHPRRVAAVAGELCTGPLSRWLADLRTRWGLPGSLRELGADEAHLAVLTDLTWRSWGPPLPALGRMRRHHLTALYAAALDPLGRRARAGPAAGRRDPAPAGAIHEGGGDLHG